MRGKGNTEVVRVQCKESLVVRNFASLFLSPQQGLEVEEFDLPSFVEQNIALIQLDILLTLIPFSCHLHCTGYKCFKIQTSLVSMRGPY